MTIRVLIADEHEIFCEGVRSVVANTVGLEFAGYATDGQHAVDLAVMTKPDVAVLGISMPVMNGIEATWRIHEALPQTSVICLSVLNEETFMSAALEAGASGYLLKDCGLEEVLRAIHTVHATGSYFSPSVTPLMIRGYVDRVGGGMQIAPRISGLTARERETLQLIAEGYATKQIAGKLGVSIKTVSTHREHLMRKLKLNSIAGLTKFAIRNGLTTIERDRPA